MDTMIVGLVSGILTTFGFLPQVIKSLRTKKVEDVAIAQPVVLLIGMSGWLLYGVMRDDLVIIMANIVSIALNLWLIVLKIKYRSNVTANNGK
ncbi:MAG TPA: SemiSWEET transporter [bacterium]|nr:SemiSWEET transporter [bacterium]HMY36871.1 SemiSWEET transporter [bacterium]HMZ05476.1 SemiSWEET transporter [bacterium]HNB09173.1 SemiSWEET transporter [bacterium]HNB57403.1 SemiSWEET transporter [bacterium]